MSLGEGRTWRLCGALLRVRHANGQTRPATPARHTCPITPGLRFWDLRPPSLRVPAPRQVPGAALKHSPAHLAAPSTGLGVRAGGVRQGSGAPKGTGGAWDFPGDWGEMHSDPRDSLQVTLASQPRAGLQIQGTEASQPQSTCPGPTASWAASQVQAPPQPWGALEPCLAGKSAPQEREVTSQE